MAELLHTLEKDTHLEQTNTSTETSAMEQAEQSKGTLERFHPKDIEHLVQTLSPVANKTGAAEACATVITYHLRQLERQSAAVIAILETMNTEVTKQTIIYQNMTRGMNLGAPAKTTEDHMSELIEAVQTDLEGRVQREMEKQAVQSPGQAQSPEQATAIQQYQQVKIDARLRAETDKKREAVHKVRSSVHKLTSTPQSVESIIVDYFAAFGYHGFESSQQRLTEFAQEAPELDNELAKTLRSELEKVAADNPWTRAYLGGIRDMDNVKQLLCKLTVKCAEATKPLITLAKIEFGNATSDLLTLKYEVSDPIKPTAKALATCVEMMRKLVELNAPEEASSNVEMIVGHIDTLYIKGPYSTIHRATGNVCYPEDAKNNMAGCMQLSDYSEALSELAGPPTPITKAKEKENRDKEKEKASPKDLQNLKAQNEALRAQLAQHKKPGKGATKGATIAAVQKNERHPCAYCLGRNGKNGLAQHDKSNPNGKCYGESLDTNKDSIGRVLTAAQRTDLIEKLTRYEVTYTGSA